MKSKIWITAVLYMVGAANLFAQSGPFVKHLMHYEFSSRGKENFILTVGLDREMQKDEQCLIYDRRDTSIVGRMNYQHKQLVDKLLINTPELKFTAFFVYPSDSSYKLVKIEELNESAVPHGVFVREKFYEGKRVFYEKYNYTYGGKNGACEEYVLHSWDKPKGGSWQRYIMTDDVMDGIYIQQEENGDTVEYGRYDKGKREGCWFAYRDYADCKDSVYYQAGKRNGVTRTWNSEGKLVIEEYYLKGEKNGLCRNWHSNGVLSFERYYKEGLLQGTSKSWSDKGVLLYVERYDTLGQREGLQESWNEEGVLIKREHYHENIYKGKCEYFYDSGKPKYLASYSNNAFEGVVKEWNEDGELILHQLYKNGELVKTYVNKKPEQQNFDGEHNVGYLADDYYSPLFYRNYLVLEADKSLASFGQKSEEVIDFLNLWYSNLNKGQKKQCKQIREIEITFLLERKSITLTEVKGASANLNQEIKDYILSRYKDTSYGNYPATIKVIVPFDHSIEKR